MEPSQQPQVQEPVFLIETEKISPNPYQPRRDFDEESLKELASSIREFGILQPLVVTKIEEPTDYGTRVRYELIAGERRLRAAQLIGLPRVPAVIRNVELARQRLELAIIENVQRANLNPIEAARAYNRLQDEFKLTQREIAQQVSKSREVIANTMRLLNLPTEMQEALARGQMSESQARLLLSVDDLAAQKTFFDEILKNNLSVRELKNKIDYFKARKAAPAEGGQARAADPEAILIQRELEEALGTAVKLEKSGDSGSITINFHSPEELRALLEKLTKQEESPPAANDFHL